MSKATTFTPEQLEIARLERNRRLREWRKANPDKVKAANIRTMLNSAEKRKATKTGGNL